MHIGNRFRLYPSPAQQEKLSQWIGCQRFIYNAKVEQYALDSYFTRKTLQHIGKHPILDCSTSQYKDKELTPFLYQVPAIVLRNGAYLWRQTMAGFLRGLNKRARKKSGYGEAGVWITSELFRFEQTVDEETREIRHSLFIGGKRENIVGLMNFVAHKPYQVPKSIHIKRAGTRWYLSFNYDDDSHEWTDADNLARLSQFSDEELSTSTLGVDCGVAIPFATNVLGDFDYSKAQKKSLAKCDKYIRRHSNIAARRMPGGSNCKKSRERIARYYSKIKQIRNDFAHQTSHAIASSPNVELIGFEKLNIVGMTKKARPKQDENGKYLKNNAAQKTGLNRAILGSCWYSVKEKTAYKARRLGKLLVEVKAATSSQECSQCGVIHAGSRQSQSLFSCLNCGYFDNADANASKVIAKRAIMALRAGIIAKDKKSRRIRRNFSNQVGKGIAEPSVATSITPTETVSDDMIAKTVVAQESLRWEAINQKLMHQSQGNTI